MRFSFFFSLFVCTVLLSSWGCDKKDKDGTETPQDGDWPSDSIRIVKSNLNFPWDILWGKDDHIWMTERNGKISKIEPKTGNTVFDFQISDVEAQGEGGLLGMAHHPDFLNNGFIYVVYNYNRSGVYTEKVVRFTFANNTLSNPTTLLDLIPASSIHNGSRLFVTSDNKLLITTGDAANSSMAQNTDSKSGKVLRINLDGSIPTDNPIANNPIWTIGHRNLQGLVIANNIIYTSEHGASIEDEVNIIEKNRNYGWPDVEGPCTVGEVDFCNSHNIKEPIWSSGSSTVATSGMDYYNNDLIPEWKNSLLVTTLKDATLFQLKLSANGLSVASVTEFFDGDWGRLRDVCVSPSGRVYLCTSNGGNNDKLIEISK